MVASQATEAGSIPVPCSKTKQHPMGCCFCVRNRERKSNPFHASARWALAVRQLDAERSLRFASRANRPSIPVPCSKTKQHPIGMLFLFLEKRKGIEPIQCKCPVGTCRSAAGCRTLPTICPQGQIGRRYPLPRPLGHGTHKGPQHGAVDDMHFEPVHLFFSRASCFGRSKKQGAALWFLSIAQLRCGAYTNRIQIERKVRSFL